MHSGYLSIYLPFYLSACTFTYVYIYVYKETDREGEERDIEGILTMA